mgnify:CR=1 FL=1
MRGMLGNPGQGMGIMHLYIATRGQKGKVDDFISDLQAQYFPYRYSPHDPMGFLQLGVRPLQLWELAFPEEHLQEVLATLNGSPFNPKDYRRLPKVLSWIAGSVRKFMGLGEVPKLIEPVQKKRIVRKDSAIDIKLIAVKKDQMGKIEMI